MFSTKLSTWALKLNKKYRFLFPQRLSMLEICKNMARTEHKWESTKRRLTFWRIFLEILPYKSFTKFGVCSKEYEKKTNISGNILSFFMKLKSKFMHRKRSFQKVRHVRQPLPTILTLTRWTALGHISVYHAEWLHQKRVKKPIN